MTNKITLIFDKPFFPEAKLEAAIIETDEDTAWFYVPDKLIGSTLADANGVYTSKPKARGDIGDKVRESWTIDMTIETNDYEAGLAWCRRHSIPSQELYRLADNRVVWPAAIKASAEHWINYWKKALA